MKPVCQQAVQEAAKSMGLEKPLSDAQLAAIDSRLQSTMRQLARTEKDWQTLSTDQRVAMTAERAMQDIAREADRKVANAQMQIVKTAATEQRIGEALANFDSVRSRALVHDIERTQDYVHGIKAEAMGNLMNLMDAVTDGTGASAKRRVAMFLWDADNPVMTRDLAREIYGNADGSTGNKVAQEGAKAWLQVIEQLRQRFNNAGGDVGRLDYGYLPQAHDSARVRSAGRDAWVERVQPLVDRARMVDEAGARLPDAEVARILGGIWETIATDGINKMEPGKGGGGSSARANRGMDHRELHFKDADAFLTYMQEYGAGSMYDAMVGHVGGISRDIGLVERYGPNPNAQMRLQLDMAAKHDVASVDNLPRSFGLTPQAYWAQVNGTASSPASARIAQIGTDVRNIQTFGKLGGAVISSITDMGTYMTTTGYNKLPYWDAIANIGKLAASREAREFLTTHGIIAESMSGDMNRWAGDHLRQNWSGRLANSTLKLSLLNAWTDTLRRAFSLTMMQGMARMAKTDWAALGEWDRALMERRGITAQDWDVIRSAELTEFGGKEHLTPEAIRASGDERANEVVAKVLGLIQDESEFAVLNPDLATKAVANFGGKQRGTVTGELARSVMQFKSFPIAMVSRHWRRMLDAPQVHDGSAPAMANRLMYAGALMVTTTALGAIAMQAKQIVSGKDPIDMTGDHAAKFWAKAVAQGGGLSIAGDMVLNDPGNSPSDYIRSTLGTFAGPAVSTLVQALSIPIENLWKAAKGKETHAIAETINVARSNAPYLNVWYAKAAMDHAGMHALQENMSPGYLGKMQKRAMDDWGQQYWWHPGTGMPDRGPDLAKAVGQ